MPAIIPLLLAEVAIAAFGITDAILIAVINIAAALAAAAINYFTTNKKDNASIMDASTGRQVMANTRDSRQPLRVVYGTNRVGGNDVFISTTGASNNNLWIVQTLSEGTCNGIHQINGVPQVFLGDKLYNQFGSKVQWWFHDGNPDQVVDANLHAAIPAWTDTLRNTCYIVWKLTYDQNYFTSLPERTVILEGLKIKDIRTGLTSFSNNAALALYNYLTNTRYGAGRSEIEFDSESWISGINYCDTKGWTFDGVLTLQGQNMQSIIDEIRTHFRGDITWFDGKIMLKCADLNYESACMNLLDEHIAVDEGGKTQITISQPGKFDIPNGLRVSFVDITKNYIPDEILIGDDYGVISDLSLPGCVDRSLAAVLGSYFLERMRLNRTIVGVFRDDAAKLEPYDIVNFTSTKLNIENQLMRVRDSNLLPGGQIELSLQYENSELYDDDYDVDIDSVYECTLPQPTDEPPNVVNVAFVEEKFVVQDKTYIRLKLSWEYLSTYPFIDHAKIMVSSDGVSFFDYATVKMGCTFAPTQVGDTWYFKVIPYNIWGVSRNLTNVTIHSYTVIGQALYPSTPQNAHYLINGNILYLAWDIVTDDDILGYEIRLGDTWQEATLVAFVEGPAKSFPGIKPGTFTFLVCAKNRRGLYSLIPATITVSSYDPFGYSQHSSFDDDFTGGSHYDTERYNHPVQGYVLRVQEGHLTGYWESGVHDLTEVVKARVWIEYFKYIDFNTGDKWNIFFEEEDKWTDKLTEDMTWMEAFGVESVGSLTMSLMWSVDNINWSEVQRAEIMSMELEARYLKYRIYLTNPNTEISMMVKDPSTLKAYIWA